MTKIQAQRLLKLADSVSKATNYDQSICERCALSHVPKRVSNFDQYYGLNIFQESNIFSFMSLTRTAKRKAAQIRKIVKGEFPTLLKEKS